jgi:hypothetical protein
VQNDEDDGNHDQDVNPIAGARESRTYIPAEKAEQPQDKQNHDDGPQHEVFPFDARLNATRLLDRVAVNLAAQQDEDAGRNGKDRQNNGKAT